MSSADAARALAEIEAMMRASGHPLSDSDSDRVSRLLRGELSVEDALAEIERGWSDPEGC